MCRTNNKLGIAAWVYALKPRILEDKRHDHHFSFGPSLIDYRLNIRIRPEVSGFDSHAQS